MPEPKALKNTEGVTSMIDVSDGLLTDLSHICDESGVGAKVYQDRIPLSRELVTVAQRLGIDPLEIALRGGEDYVLLFTASQNLRTKAIKIGEITDKGRYFIDSRGKKKRFMHKGYDHFK
jgi:thiamine-monophosphate kinase